jgi:hypothetical protein
VCVPFAGATDGYVTVRLDSEIDVEAIDGTAVGVGTR